MNTSKRPFPDTQWTLILMAATSPGSKRALEELCRAYWQPLYAFARRKGCPPSDAEDLVQGFLADLLAREDLGRAAPERGRFRTFLLSAFCHFQANSRRSASAHKRGGEYAIIPLESLRNYESTLKLDSPLNESPEQTYDRKWAIKLLIQSIREVRKEYEGAGKGSLFLELQAAIWNPSKQTRLQEVAERLDMTEGAVKVAAHRLRKRLAEQFRNNVAQTLLDPSEIDEEIQYLQGLLTQSTDLSGNYSQ